jgi:hypothetical protein
MKMKISKRALATFLSIIISITAFAPFSAYGATESALRSSVVSVAQGEVGYTGTSTYSKYGDWYGYQGSWCTTFVFWCFNKAGNNNDVKLYGSIVPSGGNCNSMISWFSNKGSYYQRSSGYTPKAGDLVFFDWSGNGSSQHVGIVTGTSGSTVYTVEGNCSGQVKSRTYTSSGSKPYNNISAIMGYGVPNFSSVGSGKNQQQTTAKTTTAKATTKQADENRTTTKQSANNTTTNITTTTSSSTTTTQQETTQTAVLENLSINASTYELQVGDTVKLNYSVEPENVSAVVGYFCDEEGIIEIGTDGDIKAIGSGTATVVVCANNDLYKQCDFTVTDAVGEVTTIETSQRKVVGTTQKEIVTTEKNVQNVLAGMGVKVDQLSQNKQLYIIPLTIIAATFVISVFVAIVKKIKEHS